MLYPLLIAPGVCAQRSIDAYNFTLSRNIVSKALPDYYRVETTDAQVVGALYFRRPETQEPLVEVLRTAELQLELQVEGSPADAAPSPVTPSVEETSRVGETVRFLLSLSRGEG